MGVASEKRIAMKLMRSGSDRGSTLKIAWGWDGRQVDTGLAQRS
jgi:hypothetical protein